MLISHYPAISPIYQMCTLLAAWLVLFAGVSQKTASTVLKALHIIMRTTLEIVYFTLKEAGYSSKTNEASFRIGIPLDIRTVYSKSGLDPVMIRKMCCPTCYKEYPENTLETTCTWKKSPRSRACGTELWTMSKNSHGSKQIPRCLFTTQSLGPWLKDLLSRPEIDDCLTQSYAKLMNLNPVHQQHMHDIQDSPAWQSLRGYLLSKYHLVFGIYVDWFNPYGNKTAGKFYSCSCNLTKSM